MIIKFIILSEFNVIILKNINKQMFNFLKVII